MGKIDLGTGVLGWRADERRTDRYGTVHLDRHSDEGCFHPASFDPIPLDDAPVGTHGQLVAVVLDTRASAHVGDWARGHGRTTPALGEQVTLGVGTVFIERSCHGTTEIGLHPDDGRRCACLHPTALYRCHNQTVRLELHTTPTEQRARAATSADSGSTDPVPP